MQARTRHRLARDAAAVLLVVVLVAVGHWGELIGREQPVGGDKTQFFYGLMSYYHECLAEGRLPIWNERWGFGFPGLAESQTGAFYPLHCLLYGLLSPVDAFRWDHLLHRLACGIVGYLSLRGLGLAPMGAWVGTMGYVGGGFARIHQDHQWAVLGMVWLPPAVWAAHAWLVRGCGAAVVLLPLVLACQLFIGHFQIAFMTLVTVTLYALGLALTRQLAARSAVSAARMLAGLAASLLLGVGLAAVQLLPTYELARYVRAANPDLASLDYHGFGGLPPWMTANLALPYLYFREPLWRPVAWTPFHTLPEEGLCYVGMLALAVALGTIWRWRRAAFVRCWTGILLVSLALSWGPFLPGFAWLLRLPGFGFFRCSARWTLVSSFAICLLAGWGIDRLRTTGRLFVWWTRISLAVLVLAACSAGWWSLFDRSARQGRPPARWVQAIVDHCVPWDKVAQTMAREMATRRGPEFPSFDDWVRRGRTPSPIRLLDVWTDVVVLELLPTLGLCGMGLVLLALGRHVCRSNRWLVVAICVADLAWFQHVFPERSAPLAHLVPDGPLLSMLGGLPEGSRVLATGGNLLLAWGLSPIPAYRTLDIPVPPLVSDPTPHPLQQLMGVAAIIKDYVPLDQADQLPPNALLFSDDQLDWWMNGSRSERALLGRGARLGTAVIPLAMAPAPGQIPAIAVALGRFHRAPSPAGPHEGFQGLHAAQSLEYVQEGPLAVHRAGTQRREATVRVREPALLVVGEMYAPGWSAAVTDPGRDVIRQPLVAVDGYWQGLPLPTPGTYTLELQYDPPGLRTGLLLTAASTLVWLGWAAGRVWARRQAM